MVQHLDIQLLGFDADIATSAVSAPWQVCRAGLGNARKIWLTRHGESEYNQRKLIGGDSSISENGQKYASALPAVLLSRLPPVRASRGASCPFAHFSLIASWSLP